MSAVSSHAQGMPRDQILQTLFEEAVGEGLSVAVHPSAPCGPLHLPRQKRLREQAQSQPRRSPGFPSKEILQRERCSELGLTQAGSSPELSMSPLCFFPFFPSSFLSLFLAAGRLFKVANKFQLMKPEKPELGAKRNKSNQYRRNRKRS